MSLTKFNKNFIICGEVDNHCLLCDETFHKLDDIEKHIRWEKHRKAIKTQTCLPKFKNDGIFKVETPDIGYFCQHCNKIVKNIKAVKDHVDTERHISNKTTPKELKQIDAKYESGTIYMKNIKIDSHQWHGVFNKKCFLCNIEVDNVVKHIQTQDHIIKLIQTETKFEGEKCYRKINNDIFQCFTCKKTFPASSFEDHWLNSDHDKNPSEPLKTNGHTEGPIKIYDRAEYYKITEHREFSIEKLAHIQDDIYYKVDLKDKKIICKKCNNAVKITENHLSNHLFNKHKIYSDRDSKMIKYMSDEIAKDVILVFEEDHGKARHELANYGRDNYIKLNCGGSKGYCTLCDKYLSAHINIFKQHVNGKVHIGQLEIKDELKPQKHKKGPTRTEMLSRYLYRMDWIPEMDSIAINKFLCIDRESFLLMKKIEHGPHFQKIKCFACDEILPRGSEKDHAENKIHKLRLLASKVIVERINFIREIRPKLYHCGLCNITLPFWETLEKHLTNMSHKMKICEKHFVHAIDQFEKNYGFLPTAKKIEHSTHNDILYANILLGMYDDN